jgi:hypothetical protein
MPFPSHKSFKEVCGGSTVDSPYHLTRPYHPTNVVDMETEDVKNLTSTVACLF